MTTSGRSSPKTVPVRPSGEKKPRMARQTMVPENVPTRTRSKRGAPGGSVGVRERLLAVALQLFSERGYHGASVSEIVAAAGVSQPVLYYYFPDKQGLFLALVDQALAAYDRILQPEGPTHGGGADRLIDLCRHGFRASLENPNLTRLLFSLGFGHPAEIPVQPRVDEVMQRFFRVVGEVVKEGIASGEFCRVRQEDVAWALFSILFKSMEEAMISPKRKPGLDGMTRMLRLVLRGFTTERSGENK